MYGRVLPETIGQAGGWDLWADRRRGQVCFSVYALLPPRGGPALPLARPLPGTCPLVYGLRICQVADAMFFLSILLYGMGNYPLKGGAEDTAAAK